MFQALDYLVKINIVNAFSYYITEAAKLWVNVSKSEDATENDLHLVPLSLKTIQLEQYAMKSHFYYYTPDRKLINDMPKTTLMQFVCQYKD